MAADMHTHSEYSHDSLCPLDDLCRAEIARGVTAFALTDHCDLDFRSTEKGEKNVGASVEAALSAAERYRGQIDVLCGVELGESLWDMAFAKELIGRFPFDVVLGSVHAVQSASDSRPYAQIDFLAMSRLAVKDFLTRYFDELLQTLQILPCDVATHLTCPFRYINGKYRLGITPAAWKGKIEDILECLIARHIALEVNTSGLGTPWNTLMPQADILERYRAMGGYLVTLGSDAHSAPMAAVGFAGAKAMLRNLGFEATFLYRNRRPQAIEL